MRLASSIVVLLMLAACSGPAPQESGEPAAAAVETAPSGEALEIYDEIGGDFTLTDQNAQPFRLADSDGKIRLLFFGFTMCPDVCPLTLSKVVQIRQLLGEDSGELLTLFVSVDPERDTPEKLRAYLRFFDLGDVRALTGTTDEIDTVVSLFKATYEKEATDSADHYLINHTSYLFLIDREGRVRGIFGVSSKAGEVVRAIRSLIPE